MLSLAYRYQNHAIYLQLNRQFAITIIADYYGFATKSGNLLSKTSKDEIKFVYCAIEIKFTIRPKAHDTKLRKTTK